MRLIVDRQQMIDQRPERLRPARQRPLRAVRPRPTPTTCRSASRTSTRPSRCSSRPGQEGLQVELFTGDDIGSVAPATAVAVRAAGQEGRRRREGDQEEPLLRRRLPVLPLRPGLLEHPQLPPAGAAVGSLKGGTYNETHFDNPKFAGLIAAAQREPDEAKRNRCCTTRRRSSTTRAATSSGASATRSTAYVENVQGLKPQRLPAARAPTTSRRVLGATHMSRHGSGDARPGPLAERRAAAWPARRGVAWAAVAGPPASGWPSSRSGWSRCWSSSPPTALGDPVRAILGKDFACQQGAGRAAHRAAATSTSRCSVRYLHWLGGLFTGNLGTSHRQPAAGLASRSAHRRQHAGAGARSRRW